MICFMEMMKKMEIFTNTIKISYENRALLGLFFYVLRLYILDLLDGRFDDPGSFLRCFSDYTEPDFLDFVLRAAPVGSDSIEIDPLYALRVAL